MTCSICLKVVKYSNNNTCIMCALFQSKWTSDQIQSYHLECKNLLEKKEAQKGIRQERLKKRALKALLRANKPKTSHGQETINTLIFDKVTCSSCNGIKLRTHIDGEDKRTYRDQDGQRWEGRKCPHCTYLRQQKKNHKNKKTFDNINCVRCNNSFKPVRSSNKYCSYKCSTVYKKRINKSCITCNKDLPPYRKLYCSSICRPKIVTEKKVYNCLSCQKETSNRKYCSKKCKQKNYRKLNNKQYRLLRKRGQKNAKLKTVSWSQIEEFYSNRPEGFHVDHIIPLNHPDVCGLHVPWNFQYLAPSENNIKSNNFDGTYNNESWRKKLDTNLESSNKKNDSTQILQSTTQLEEIKKVG